MNFFCRLMRFMARFKVHTILVSLTKSLMRMLGPSGNTQARNLFEIVAYLQHAEGVRFEIRSAPVASRAKRRPSSQGIKWATPAASRR